MNRHGSNLDIIWDEDPRMLGIRLARYKFVAKMFQGFSRVLEIGCGSGILSKVVEYAVDKLDKTDANEGVRFNPITDKLPNHYNGIFALDVLEHVSDEHGFMNGIVDHLYPGGSCIIGMPSKESQTYASSMSIEGHINCKTEEELRLLMKQYFRTVYMFGMNDEVIHTGFGPMCHYRLALAS